MNLPVQSSLFSARGLWRLGTDISSNWAENREKNSFCWDGDHCLMISKIISTTYIIIQLTGIEHSKYEGEITYQEILGKLTEIGVIKDRVN